MCRTVKGNVNKWHTTVRLKVVPMKYRILIAACGVGIYWLIFRPNWANPYLFLYDVPTIAFACLYAARLFPTASSGAHQVDAAAAAALLSACLLGWLAQYWAWPLSGHLNVATTAALLECGETRDPRWFRAASWSPVVLLVLIRTFRPQSELMANRFNTVSALVVGCLLYTAVEVHRRRRM